MPVVLSLSLVLSVALVAPGRAAEEPVAISQQAMQQIAAIQAEKESWTPAQRKIGSKLLLAAKKSRGAAMAVGMPELRSSIVLDSENKVLVDIRADVSDELLDRIKALGGEVVSSFPQYHAVRARIPITQIEPLASESAVQTIRPADIPFTNKTNTSQGDVAHRADDTRAGFGVDGTGVKVGVLSDSVDPATLAALQLSGDLPAGLTVLPGQSGTGYSEGTAMLEIVYDLAPGASLYFATAKGGEATFASNIIALKDAGCNVIVDDLGYFLEPTFQDGIVAQAVETVSAAGVLYFSAAGNEGNKNDGTSGVWEGDFAAIAAFGGTAHNFGGGASSVQITADPPQLITLQWSDPMGGSANDYDLFLLNSTLTTVIDSSEYWQTGSEDPFEVIDSTSRNDVGNRLVIMQYPGSAGRYLRLNTHRGRLGISTSGQIYGHSAAASACSVAAVNVSTAGGGHFTSGTSVPVETYSSDGLRRVFYLADGTPITPGNYSSTGGVVRQKPDLAGADCVATATPDPPQGSFNPFCGTSAAAPHVAAIAALMLDHNPSLTPAQVRTAMTTTALDIEAVGVDRDSGYGIVDAMAAVNCVATPPTVVSVNRQSPTGQNTNASSVTWRVTFSKPISAATVSTSDFTLTDVSSSITGESVTSTSPSSGTTTTIDVISNTGAGDGTLRLDVLAAASIYDSYNNDYNSDYTSGQTYIVDKTPPTVVSVNRQTPSAQNTNASSVTWRVTLNELVNAATVSTTDFTLVDVSSSITGESKTSTSPTSGTTTTIDVTVYTGSGNGTLRLDVLAAATISDPTGNDYNSNFTSGQIYIIDKTAPTVTSDNRQTPSAQNTSATSVTWRVTFSESVDAGTASTSDFTLMDVYGTISGEYIVSTSPTSGTTTTIDVTANTGSGNGTLRLDVPSSATIYDLAGNDYSSTYTAGQTYIIDKTAPTVTSIIRLGPSPTNASSVMWRVTFNESVDAATASTLDFTLVDVYDTISAESIVSTTPTSGTTTTIDVTANTGSGDGTLRLDVLAAATISDLAGNDYNSNYTGGPTCVIDKTPPTVNSANRLGASPTNASSVTWRFTFIESVDAATASTMDFTLVDVYDTISGESIVSTTPTSGTTTTVDVTVNTGSGDGTLRLDLLGATATISDAAGNDVTDDFTSGETFIVDKAAPTVWNVTSDTNDGTYGVDEVIDVRLEFSEAVFVTGSPQLLLETGEPDRYAVYTSGDGTDTLVFEYVVEQGDASADLDYVDANALELNGGTIRDECGNDADLTLAEPGAPGSLGANKAIVVNTCVAPTNPSATPSTICLGDSSTLSATPGSGGDTVVWYSDSCGGTPVTSPVFPIITTIYYAKTKNSTTGCLSPLCADPVTVTVKQPPTPATAGPDQTICALGTTSGLGGNTPLVGTGAWSVVSGGTGTFSPNNTTPNATFTHTGGVGPVELWWTISNAPCDASHEPVLITIAQPPEIVEPLASNPFGFGSSEPGKCALAALLAPRHCLITYTCLFGKIS